MKTTLKVISLLTVLTAAACSKYEANNTLPVTVKYKSYSDSLTCVNRKIQTVADTNTYILENNIYKSTLTVEG